MAKKIYLSPSDQNANKYAYGNTTENVQCCRIADACEKALVRCGFLVMNNQTGTMEERVAESNAWGADLHIPIHTNAFNGEVSGTRMFYFSEGSEGKSACTKIFSRLSAVTPGTSDNISAYPTLYELRKTTMPAVYVEAEFHDVPDVAKWIIEHVTDIGETICQGVCDYFGVAYKKETAVDPEEPEWSRKEGFWQKATERGIVDGTRPEDYLKRSELIAVLGRIGLI